MQPEPELPPLPPLPALPPAPAFPALPPAPAPPALPPPPAPALPPFAPPEPVPAAPPAALLLAPVPPLPIVVLVELVVTSDPDAPPAPTLVVAAPDDPPAPVVVVLAPVPPVSRDAGAVSDPHCTVTEAHTSAAPTNHCVACMALVASREPRAHRSAVVWPWSHRFVEEVAGDRRYLMTRTVGATSSRNRIDRMSTSSSRRAHVRKAIAPPRCRARRQYPPRAACRAPSDQGLPLGAKRERPARPRKAGRASAPARRVFSATRDACGRTPGRRRHPAGTRSTWKVSSKSETGAAVWNVPVSTNDSSARVSISRPTGPGFPPRSGPRSSAGTHPRGMGDLALRFFVETSLLQ